MKEFSNTATLSRFAKDKRLRTERPERTERRERTERTPKPYGSSERPKRHSYNPNFGDDNRLKGESRGFAPRHNDDEAPRGNKPFKGASKPFGKSDRKPFGKAEGGSFHKSGSKPFAKGEGKPFAKSAGGRKPFHKSEDKPKSYPKYNPNRATDEIRLNRYVAQSGLCSRREADEFISAGLVSVNGVIVTELGTKVKSTDIVKFNDERLQGEQNVYLVLNKPKGYVTTLEDDHADKTVMELVKNACKERIYPVGRLDKNSLGLLLFTNDGDITRQLTHPSLKKKKIYEVTLDKAVTRADFEQLAEGVTLEDGEAFFDEISYLKDDKKSVGVEIHSGRNRIVRRMFEHLGYKVTKLDRVYYAGLTKKNLKRGAWRFLTSDEVARLKSGRYE